MSYKQTKLIELMKKGHVPGEHSVPNHIETVISNVFLFDGTVYKCYKNDNEFFNKNFRDLSTKDARFSFTRKDFAWNHALCPSIYTDILGVSVVDDKIVLQEPTDDAQELVFIMNRAETNDVLYNRLIRGELLEKDCYQIGKQLAEQLECVRPERPTGNYYDIFASHVQDARDWIASVSEHIPEDEWIRYCEFLDQFRTENKEWYEGELSERLAYSGDVHSHNALYTNGTLSLMDTYSPKDEWRVAHELIPFYRMGADIWALGSKGMFEEFVRGYEAGQGMKIDRSLDAPFVLYAMVIMVSYLYMLQKTDSEKVEAAKKAHKFIQSYLADIST